MNKTAKLKQWQEMARREETAYAGELARMDGREQLYRGSKTLSPLVRRDKKTTAAYVRNIVAEAVEGQVDSSIPAPKLKARRNKCTSSPAFIKT